MIGKTWVGYNLKEKLRICWKIRCEMQEPDKSQDKVFDLNNWKICDILHRREENKRWNWFENKDQIWYDKKIHPRGNVGIGEKFRGESVLEIKWLRLLTYTWLWKPWDQMRSPGIQAQTGKKRSKVEHPGSAIKWCSSWRRTHKGDIGF